MAPSKRLVLVSFLLLFNELALIRYLPSQVRILSYFSSLVLLGSFLGLGVGSLLARSKRRLLPFAPALVALALLAAKWFSTVLVVQRQSVDYYLWTIYVDLAPSAHSVGIPPTLLLFFGVVALAFVPLGQELGILFRSMAPLRAYSLDILGSLAGSLCLTLLAALAAPPIVWFGVSAVVFALLLPREDRRSLRGLAALAGIAGTLALVWPVAEETWTPYYRIRQHAFPAGFDLTVNASLHQTALDLSDEACARSKEAAYIRDEYATPYTFYEQVNGHPARSVLILGAGTGNDATVALSKGIERVVVVEIDPHIAALGRTQHPNAPYADPRVTLHVTDARSFLRRTKERFDLVLFGTLDSQTLLAGLGTLRLDNYVYTLQSLREARGRLEPDGVLGLFFMVGQDWIGRRLFRMVEAADGQPPLVHRPEKAGELHVTPIFNYVLLAGPGSRAVAPERRQAASASIPAIRPATDDWPYLYLRERGLPAPYPVTLSLLFGASIAAVAPFTLRKTARGRGGRTRAYAYFFFLGAGFMLIETKGITELSLLYGSTWKVSAVVIASVLATILVANLVALRFDLARARWLFPALLGILALNYAVSAGAFLALPDGVRGSLGGLFFALPVFFAGLLFARRFQAEPMTDRALGWNLLGAMGGGLCEYASMAAGVSFLYVLAFVFYLGALSVDPGVRKLAADDPRAPSAT